MLLESQCIFQNLPLFLSFINMVALIHCLMIGPLGNSEFCFPQLCLGKC